jgi:hypothetical protein
MSTRSPHSEASAALDPDPRWQLVERIVSSQCFARSERLSSFLTCVCELARRGELEQINEQYIGTTVFGRRPDYDPGADSIVRSHASRLRHRLIQYFAEEGAREEWLLTIPKGSYLPVFQFRAGSSDAVVVQDADGVAGPNPGPPANPTPALPIKQATLAQAEAGHTATSARDRYLVPVLCAALVLVTVIALACAAAMIFERRTLPASAGNISESKRLFWSHFFNGKDQTVVVIADSGLVMLQGVTKQRVTLPMYLNGTYLQTIPPSPSSSETLNFATRRYTSIVDVSIVSKILRMTGVDLDNTKFIYSRDLRPSQIKQGNVILLGTYESTPWVQLFEPGMNFYFQNDLARGVFSVMNRQPRAGEQTAYDSRRDDPDKTVYGVVAYRPSLSGSGKVLIVEGQSMAGTETASDFVFDDGYLLPFLQSIRRPDGTIPYFELLLRSKSISGEASRLETIATRIEDR